MNNGAGSKTEKGRELLGSAVSTGWSAFNKARSKGGQAISNLREQRGGDNHSQSNSSGSGSGGPAADGGVNGHTGSGGSGMGRPGGDGPYLANGTVKRRGNLPGAQVFGRDVAESAVKWKCEILGRDADEWDEAKRERMNHLPAVAARCVDYRE